MQQENAVKCQQLWQSFNAAFLWLSLFNYERRLAIDKLPHCVAMLQQQELQHNGSACSLLLHFGHHWKFDIYGLCWALRYHLLAKMLSIFFVFDFCRQFYWALKSIAQPSWLLHFGHVCDPTPFQTQCLSGGKKLYALSVCTTTQHFLVSQKILFCLWLTWL